MTMARTGGRRWTLRDALVVTQIAVTTVLLVAAGLLTRSLMAAQQIGIGFRTAGIAIVSTDMKMIGYDDARAKEFYDRVLERLRSLPDVESAALAERLPFSINYNRNNVFLPDRHGPSDKGLVLDVTRVSPEYFATLGVPLLQGRNFNAADTPRSPRVAVVNETMARRFWPNENAVGKHFRLRGLDGPDVEIVGIAPDHKVSSLGEAPTPYIHYAGSQQLDSNETILVRGRGDAAATLNTVRREIAAIEPNTVFLDNQTMDAQVAATLLPARLGAIGVSVVGVVAMALAAIGLYGVIAYAVARRSREIGIRMALGAQPSAVVALVLRQGLGLAAAGLGVGAVIALGAAFALSRALYGVSIVDPMAWGATIAILVTVAALANVVPARRRRWSIPLARCARSKERASFGEFRARRRVGLRAHLHQILVVAARGRVVLRQCGGTRRAEHRAKAVRFLLQRRLVLDERVGRAFQLEQQVAEQLSSGCERSGCHRALVRRVFAGRRRPHFRDRFVCAAVGERKPRGRAAALNLDLFRPVRSPACASRSRSAAACRWRARAVGQIFRMRGAERPREMDHASAYGIGSDADRAPSLRPRPAFERVARGDGGKREDPAEPGAAPPMASGSKRAATDGRLSTTCSRLDPAPSAGRRRFDSRRRAVLRRSIGRVSPLRRTRCSPRSIAANSRRA
jgi:hypothetical protein